MAAGDRKLFIHEIKLKRAPGAIRCEADWHVEIEDRAGVDRYAAGGTVTVDLGTPAQFATKTGAQIIQAVKDEIAVKQAAGEIMPSEATT